MCVIQRLNSLTSQEKREPAPPVLRFVHVRRGGKVDDCTCPHTSEYGTMGRTKTETTTPPLTTPPTVQTTGGGGVRREDAHGRRYGWSVSALTIFVFTVFQI